jgi:hypothetical protein
LGRIPRARILDQPPLHARAGIGVGFFHMLVGNRQLVGKLQKIIPTPPRPRFEVASGSSFC